MIRWTDVPVPSPVVAPAAWQARLRDRPAPARAALAAAHARGVAAGLAVALDASAFEAALAHVRRARHERGGLLVGTPVAVADPGGAVALVHVTQAIAGVDGDATALSLRLDATVWSRAGAAVRAGETVVGWFHSHPDLGAFFSDTDRRTQAAFFAQRYSLGWVIDPVRGEHAWFAGGTSVPVRGAAVVAG